MSSRVLTVLFLLLVQGSLIGCGGGFIHRVDQQQGNVITNTMLAKLKPNMTREQVQFVLGLPVLKNSFDSARWDYIYTYAERSQTPQTRHLTLHFEEDVLVKVEGNFDLNATDEELTPSESEEGSESSGSN